MFQIYVPYLLVRFLEGFSHHSYRPFRPSVTGPPSQPSAGPPWQPRKRDDPGTITGWFWLSRAGPYQSMATMPSDPWGQVCPSSWKLAKAGPVCSRCWSNPKALRFKVKHPLNGRGYIGVFGVEASPLDEQSRCSSQAPNLNIQRGKEAFNLEETIIHHVKSMSSRIQGLYKSIYKSI